jgi:hypothetical protein
MEISFKISRCSFAMLRASAHRNDNSTWTEKQNEKIGDSLWKEARLIPQEAHFPPLAKDKAFCE